MPARKTPKHSAPADLPPEAARVLRKFRVVFNSVRRHFRQTETKVGISGAHVWALAVIGERPGIGVSELAAALDIHQSTASNLLRTLSEEALVSVEKDESDRRAVKLSVSARGRRILKAAPNPHTGVLPDALLELDPRTLKRLDRDLDELVALLAPDNRGHDVPMGQEDR